MPGSLSLQVATQLPLIAKHCSQDRVSVQNATVVPSGKTICVSRAYGTMLGQNVTVVSSGIDAQNSAMCTMELLSCASHIKDFIYAGTSGFSPAVSVPPLLSIQIQTCFKRMSQVDNGCHESPSISIRSPLA